MIIDKALWIKSFMQMAELMIENKTYLSQIDSKFGDGDHGVTIEKIAKLIQNSCEEWKQQNWSLKTFFQNIGNGITNVNGGSAGPLYGTFFSGLAECLEDEVECDATLFARIMNSGLEELQYLTTAKVGDKTMMDTLIPAIKALNTGSNDIKEMITNAYEQALQGAKDSENYVSKFGRAKSYKELTIGTPDAGAVSCTYIFTGFYQAIVMKGQ